MSKVPLKKKKKKGNTKIREEDGYTIIRYYWTDIVKFKWGEIILASGGHRTQSTKQRINQASDEFSLGVRVHQDKNKWYVTFNNLTSEFVEGMVITYQ